MRKICPKCGNKEFYSTAHVTQTWKVDTYGNFIEAQTECDETTHVPSDEDLWTCAKCGYEAAGKVFNIEDKDKYSDIFELCNKWNNEMLEESAWCGHNYAAEQMGYIWVKAYELGNKYEIEYFKEHCNEPDYCSIQQRILTTDADFTEMEKIIIAEEIDKVFKTKLHDAMTSLVDFYEDETGESFKS